VEGALLLVEEKEGKRLYREGLGIIRWGVGFRAAARSVTVNMKVLKEDLQSPPRPRNPERHPTVMTSGSLVTIGGGSISEIYASYVL